MSRDIDWHVFDKAADVTASAVRGAMGSQGNQPATYVGEGFREIYAAFRKGTDEMPSTTPLARSCATTEGRCLGTRTRSAGSPASARTRPPPLPPSVTVSRSWRW